MSYDPLVDPEIAAFIEDNDKEPQLLRDSGVALLSSDSDACINKIKKVVDFVTEIDILCSNGSISDALIARNKIGNNLREIFRAHPIGLIVDIEKIDNIEPLIFVTHGVFSRIVFVIASDEIPKINGKIYQIITTINSLAPNMLKHFGYKTHFVVKAICSKLTKDYRVIQKKMSQFREDNRLSEVVVDQVSPIITEEKVVEDSNENIKS